MEIEKLKKSNTKRYIIIGSIVVLILAGITLTFTKAKYKTTTSIPLVNGTINYDLSDLNLIGVYIQEGEEYIQTNDIPSSGYEFNSEKSYCTVNNENIDVTLNYDMETQNLTVTPLTKKGTKCYLYFDEASSATDVIEDTYEENQGMLAYDETVDNNLRYIGRDPNNYVYFNCDDYNNPSSSTCELWRIIGIFNENSHGISGKKLVKLIRNDSLGIYAWDMGNNWPIADLQDSLNGNYLNGSNFGNGKGITVQTREIIENATWKLGGGRGSFSNISDYYKDERGTIVYNGHATTWSGKIALMYPSDYGYATSGGATTNRSACLAEELSNWGSSSYSDCKNNSWIFNNSNQWTLMPTSSLSYQVYYINSSGNVYNTDSYQSQRNVRPTVYLTATVSITGGDGSRSNPYTLSN